MSEAFAIQRFSIFEDRNTKNVWEVIWPDPDHADRLICCVRRSFQRMLHHPGGSRAISVSAAELLDTSLFRPVAALSSRSGLEDHSRTE
jgi:hypothetical protein